MKSLLFGIVFIIAVAAVCVSLAFNNSPFLAFWGALFLLGGISYKS